MNERLDYILILLSIEQYFWCRIGEISNAFERAGLGSPHPYLQRLVEQGYIEQGVGGSQFKLKEKGESIYQHGGFTGKARVTREVRVARLLTLVVIMVLLIFTAVTAGINKPQL